MAKLEIIRAADSEISGGSGALGHRVVGAVRSCVVSPRGFSLWMRLTDLDDLATIEWPPIHGDEAVYVVEGAFEVDGRVTPARGAAIVESDVVTRGSAIGPTRIVHMGPADSAQPMHGINGPPSADSHGVHVVGPRGTYANTTETADSHYFADSTCPTCRITLLSVGRTLAYESEPHTHSQDELMHVLSGSVMIGRRHIVPGDTVAIAANTRYGFRGGEEGFVFLNYRRDASRQAHGRDAPARLEGGAANDMTAVMDLR